MSKKIVIDPGHGGEDPGTSGNGIIEKNFNLEISKYMLDRLKELGIDASITRDSDVTLSPSERPKKAQSFYGTGTDVIVVSNHINSGGSDRCNDK
jgi:N-acetylmuramoyl-L-alanine amidase